MTLNKLYTFSGKIKIDGEEVICTDSYLEMKKTSKEDLENFFMHRKAYTISLGGLCETTKGITKTWAGMTRTNAYFTGDTPEEALADFKKYWVGDGQVIADGKQLKLSWITSDFKRAINRSRSDNITKEELSECFNKALEWYANRKPLETPKECKS